MYRWVRPRRCWYAGLDMTAKYEKAIAVLIAESIGISPSRVKVTTRQADNAVVASWQTSMLLQGDKREALLARAQALLPEPLRLRIE
jgi:surface antigen